MSLACQKNSYLNELFATVLSCEPASCKTETGDIDGFEVLLSDSVLFPEGGGQPDDRGTIDGIPVMRVMLKDGKAVHFLTSPLPCGSEVQIKVDWKRRFDHMQQHSGQHLITAVIDKLYGYKTISWSLGQDMCRIGLSTKSISPEELQAVEQLCNQYIREARPMYPTYYDSADDPALIDIRSRGLPEGVVGPIRVMVIEGIDVNLCCGTHVSNLAHLQAIKLLGVEKGKKGDMNLLFHVGGRVLEALAQSQNIEKQLNALLNDCPSEFPELVKKVQDSFRVANKNATNLLRELVVYEAERFSNELASSKAQLFSHHRKEGDSEYMNTLVQRIVCSESVIKFITVGDDKGAGSFLLVGPQAIIDAIGPRIAEVIDGKGAGKNGRYQGKANKLSQKHKAEKLIIDSYLASQ